MSVVPPPRHYFCDNPWGPRHPGISGGPFAISLDSETTGTALSWDPLRTQELTDLEVNAGKASKDLEEGEHVLLAGEELEVGLLVHVPVLSAPT